MLPITYHAGVLAMLRALARPTKAADFWEAYQALQSAYILHGKTPDIQESLCRACDELYYFMRYANLDAQPENDLLSSAAITANTGVESGWDAISLDLAPLTDPSALQHLRGQSLAAAAALAVVLVVGASIFFRLGLRRYASASS